MKSTSAMIAIWNNSTNLFRPQARRLALLIGAALLILGPVGCGGAKEKLVEARGTLFVGDKPATGVSVTLVPESTPTTAGEYPSAIVDEKGRFTLKTYDPLTRESPEGAREGRYIVLLTWVPQPTGENLEAGQALGDKLGGKYRDPKKSTLRVEVKEGSPELEAIKLPASDRIK